MACCQIFWHSVLSFKNRTSKDCCSIKKSLKMDRTQNCGFPKSLTKMADVKNRNTKTAMANS